MLRLMHVLWLAEIPFNLTTAASRLSLLCVLHSAAAVQNLVRETPDATHFELGAGRQDRIS